MLNKDREVVTGTQAVSDDSITYCPFTVIMSLRTHCSLPLRVRVEDHDPSLLPVYSHLPLALEPGMQHVDMVMRCKGGVGEGGGGERWAEWYWGGEWMELPARIGAKHSMKIEFGAKEGDGVL